MKNDEYRHVSLAPIILFGYPAAHSHFASWKRLLGWPTLCSRQPLTIVMIILKRRLA